MRVFADTNFLISSLATRGLSHEVFNIILSEHELLIGEFVIQETLRIFEEKFKLPPSRLNDIKEFLREFELIPLPKEKSEIEVRDEDDRWVLASAISSKADILLTGDKDLLEVSHLMEKPKILSPRGFWEYLKR